MGNMDQDVTKKFKGLDGHAVPIAYVSSKGNSGHPVLEASKSFEENKDGLTGGADGNTRADHHKQGKNGSDSVRTADNDVKDHPQVHPNNEGEINRNFTTSNDLVRVPIGSPYEKIATSTPFLSPSAGERLPFDAMVLEQLKNAQVMQEGGNASPKTEGDFTLPNDAKNILTNLGSVSSNAPPDCETHETSISETITRLHQLLESSSRTDAVAAR